MVSESTILQCGMCHRQHDGQGEVLPFQYSFKVPQIVACGRADCADCVSANLERERARKRRKNEECRMKNQRDAGRIDRHESKQVCRSARNQRDAGPNFNQPKAEVRLPYKDSETEAKDGESRIEDGRAAALARDNGGQAGPSLSQEEFVASGKADSANDRLLEFFEHLISSGQVGRWQSRKLLKEICKNDYINNRIDNLRPHFAEKGLKIVNGEVSPAEGLPKSSHYRLLLMSDGEFGDFQRSGKVPLT